MTSLAELSLASEFHRGHGALYDALAAGRIDGEAFAALPTGTLPQLVDGEQASAWIGAHDKIDYGLLERAVAQLPAEAAAQVREACTRWGPAAVRDRRHSLSAPGRRMLPGTRPRSS